MRAWRVHELGEPAEVLQLDEVDDLRPSPGRVVLDVEAASLNFSDVLLCRGGYQVKPSLPFTPGAEAAGTVAAVGEGVTDLELGQRVLATPEVGHGAFSEQTLASAADVFPIPGSMAFAVAASMHVTYQTAFVALRRRAAIRPGEVLLVHAGAGGAGSAAIQLGRAAGARVFATAGGVEKVEVCRRLGAELAVDYRVEDFVDIVKEATGGRGADVIYDPVGGDVFDRSRRCIASEGRILVIGFTGGRFAEAPTNHVLVKNYSVVGVHWGLYRERAPEYVREVHERLCRLHEQGAIDPLISDRVAFEEIPTALTRLAGRGTWGKIVYERGD